MRVVADGPVLNVFWTRLDTGARLAHQRSSDGGATWLPAPALLTGGALGGVAGHGSVVMAFDDAGSVMASNDTGATWSPSVGHGIGLVKDVAVGDAGILLVGRPNAASHTLLMNVSADGGLTWLPVPHVVPSARLFEVTALATDALLVHLRFRDNFEPTGYVLQSDDGGLQWRFVTDAAGNGLHAWAGNAIAVTRTGVNGLDQLAYVMAGHTALGSGTAGTGGITPQLEGMGLPSLGRTFALSVRQARGGALGILGASFAAPVGIPFGGGTLYLAPPIVPIAFVASGVAGAPGAGAASSAIAVPSSTGFQGLSMTSQAFVLDPGAAAGFAATRAVETWIR
ncbi:MAG: exo-alpha-sialidase [Planctomycetes bacterium]|nr:exo-alpha-sialidase [Planctomycetota bacterium]